jgi:hypothetical protein
MLASIFVIQSLLHDFLLNEFAAGFDQLFFDDLPADKMHGHSYLFIYLFIYLNCHILGPWRAVVALHLVLACGTFYWTHGLLLK